MIYQAEHFSLDTTCYRLIRDGSQHPIEPQVFDLIIYLIDNRDRVVPRDELLDKLWNGRIVSDSAINARIKLARRALGDTGKLQKFIKTIHRRGYQFIGEGLTSPNSNKGSDHGVTPGSEIADKPSIVVLPIEAPDNDEANLAIANGLTEIIIANLSCYRELLVIDPESAFAYRGDETDSVGFSERLAVEYIVKGGIRRSGNRVRISVQLLEPATGKTLWVQRLERNLEDVFDLEDEVASRIAINLVGHIDEKSRASARYKRPENLTAFDCVVRARPGVESMECEENARARQLLQQAIGLDQDYATAYANLALNHCAEYESPWCSAPDEVLKQAEIFAQKAVNLDSYDCNAHVAVASVQMLQKKYGLAETHLDKAIECNPNSYNAFCCMSWVLALTGRAAEVKICGATALRLNPLAPDNCLMAMILAHYSQREYRAALDVMSRIQEPHAQSEAFHAACLAQLGLEQETQQAAASAIELGGDDIRNPDWLEPWVFADQADQQHLLDGLYKAGILQRPTTSREKPSIAVLQFSNLSADPDQRYFCEGMALNICSRLSRIRSLLVKSGFAYDPGKVSATQIARELEVGYLLGGSLQREGDRLRVSVELTDGHSGEIKWSERFDRVGDAIIDIQDDIASAIVGTLWSYSGAIRDAELDRMVSKPTTNFNAFDYILKGIYHKEKFTAESLRLAHECFNKALTLDPLSAEAYGWSAWTHMVDILMGWSDDVAGSLRQAYAQARASIASDTHCEMGHWALAEAYILDADHERGFREFDKAMEINPNNPDLMVTKGGELVVVGQVEAGFELIQQGMDHNKHHPEWYFWHLGIACFAAGHFTDSIDAFNHMSAHNKDTLTYLSASYVQTGDLAKARKQAGELLKNHPGFNADEIAETHAYLLEPAQRTLVEGVRQAIDSLQPRDKLRIV